MLCSDKTQRDKRELKFRQKTKNCVFFGNNQRKSHLLFMTPATLRSPPLKLSNRTTAPRSEKQHSPTINRSHPPQLSSQTLVIRIPFAPSFPRQPIDLLAPSRSNAILRLYLQIELHRLLHPFALRVPTPPRSGAAAQVEERDRGREEDGEGEEVGGRGD